MSRASAVAAAAAIACWLALGGCGDGDDQRAATTQTTVTVPPPSSESIDAPVPAALRGAARATFRDGRAVAEQSGCLACHRVGSSGSDSPGSNLSGIGDRLPEQAIRRALVDGDPPMPSYRDLPRGELDALVAFLAALRDAGCPDDGDCG